MSPPRRPLTEHPTPLFEGEEHSLENELTIGALSGRPCIVLGRQRIPSFTCPPLPPFLHSVI